jgi:hypothetical protein
MRYRRNYVPGSIQSHPRQEAYKERARNNFPIAKVFIFSVIPAQAGIQASKHSGICAVYAPACP